ncbi:MAG: putative phosphatase regulatory subunit-domain-containing protein [Benjaminiella poitrasii]|nr:MAG: putative phosphatase regulatory subunit-domain-containing protein [Benjaminiella poitrasii]
MMLHNGNATSTSKRRVALNKKPSSLLLDYQSMNNNNNNKAEQEENLAAVTAAADTSSSDAPNEYTRQLVANALSLSKEDIITSPKTTDKQKTITLPPPLSSLPLLKPSLKTSRSASAPCSPTSGIKSVHFNNHNLEDICLFRKAQTPLSVNRKKSVFWANDSSGSSSDSSEEEETSDEEDEETTLVCVNWPTRLADIIDRKNKVIRVDKNLIKYSDGAIIGKLSVRNLSYQKTVTIRYSFDFWKTTGNLEATFSESHKVYDVFTFRIQIPSNASTFYFAVNYKVGSGEFWENNDGRNYEIKVVTNTKRTSTTKKKIIQSDLNDMILSHQKKKKKKLLLSPAAATSSSNIKEDKNGLKSRYDFGQSIHQAKKDTNSNSMIPTNNTTQQQRKLTSTTSFTAPIPILSPSPLTSRRQTSSSTSPICHSPISGSPSLVDLNSQSYTELVNKYCFYSTSPSRSPMSINS